MQHNSTAQMAGVRMEVEAVRAFQPLVDSVCRRYLRSRHDVEDAMQDTFVKMISHRMDSSSPRLAGWLSAAAYTSCVDQIRRASSEHRRRMGWSRIYSPSDDQPSQQEEICRQVEEALSRLDEPTRQLLVERFYDKVPLHVIARRTGVSVSTVSRWASAALRALGSVLREMGLSESAQISLT